MRRWPLSVVCLLPYSNPQNSATTGVPVARSVERSFYGSSWFEMSGHRASRADGFDLRTHGDSYVKVMELARYWNVSADTVYRDIKKGALPAYRVGSSGAIRISIEDARRYGRPER